MLLRPAIRLSRRSVRDSRRRPSYCPPVVNSLVVAKVTSLVRGKGLGKGPHPLAAPGSCDDAKFRMRARFGEVEGGTRAFDTCNAPNIGRNASAR